MRLTYHTLDVFTDRVFGGNPLAVFPDATGLDDATMLRIARELNLSETVFLLPEDPATEFGAAPARVRTRIFTPGYEVPFAGHPTVGTGWFLVASGLVAARSGETRVTVMLEENVGSVPVRIDLDDTGRPTRATLTAAEPPTERDPQLDGLDAAALGRILSLDAHDIGGVALTAPHPTRPLEPAFASVGLPFLIVPVPDVATASRARIDSAAWNELLPEGSWSRMICVVAPVVGESARGEVAGGNVGGGDVGGGRPNHGHPGDIALHVRTFCPDAGVAEDPATGSANAALAAYLARRVTAPAPATLRWRSRQGIEMGRASELDLEVDLGVDIGQDGGRIAAVRVGGTAIAVSQCEMEIPTP
jgi:trans-2,3-dihydro-3-hydroxyanthranilate isomerase